MKHYKSMEFLPIFGMPAPLHQHKVFLATVTGESSSLALQNFWKVLVSDFLWAML